MNDPQIWTLTVIFGTSLIAMLTLVSTLFLRIMRAEFATMRAEIGGVRVELTGEIKSVRAELTGEINSVRTELTGEINSVRSDLRAEIAALRSEMVTKFDHLDRDVQALTRKVFGD